MSKTISNFDIVTSVEDTNNSTNNNDTNSSIDEVDDISNWTINDFINNLTESEKEEIYDKTNTFIWKSTEGRSGKYWKDRMAWVNMLMHNRFYEPSTKNKVIFQLRGFDLTFEKIMKMQLYHYLVCHYEIKRLMKKHPERYNMQNLISIRRKIASNIPLTKVEKDTFLTLLYDGENIQSCINHFFRSLSKLKSGGKRKMKKKAVITKRKKTVYNSKKRKQHFTKKQR